MLSQSPLGNDFVYAILNNNTCAIQLRSLQPAHYPLKEKLIFLFPLFLMGIVKRSEGKWLACCYPIVLPWFPVSWEEPRISDLKSNAKGGSKLSVSLFFLHTNHPEITRAHIWYLYFLIFGICTSSYLISVFPLGIAGRENRGPGYINSAGKKFKLIP